MRQDQRDPYAPPPAHKERSGAVVRLAIVAALLGAAAWGYTQYAQQPQTALVAPQEEQRVADSSYDSGYQVTEPDAATPAQTTNPSPSESAAPEETPG